MKRRSVPSASLSAFMRIALIRVIDVGDGWKVAQSVNERTKNALRHRGLATRTEKGWRLTEAGLRMRQILVVTDRLERATS